MIKYRFCFVNESSTAAQSCTCNFRANACFLKIACGRYPLCAAVRKILALFILILGFSVGDGKKNILNRLVANIHRIYMLLK